MIKNSKSTLPGFHLTLGYVLIYLALVVVIPLSGLFIKTAELDMADFIKTITSERVMHAYYVTFSTSFYAAIINTIFGTLIAWVLVRYEFKGKRIFDALIDLPFALPTAVAGIALTSIYAKNGIIGSFFAQFGIKIAFTKIGIVIALVFIGIPFVVRTVEPILKDLDPELEECALSLGATKWQLFCRIILPNIFPALLTGFALAFARGIGEYGSVIFIAGNIPVLTEIVPLLIVIKLEQFNYAGATAIALVMLMASFFLLLFINLLNKYYRKYELIS